MSQAKEKMAKRAIDQLSWSEILHLHAATFTSTRAGDAGKESVAIGLKCWVDFEEDGLASLAKSAVEAK